MARYDIRIAATGAGGRIHLDDSPPRWPLWLAGASALVGLGAWWLWPSAPPEPVKVLAAVAPAQAQQAGQAWPFGGGAPLAQAVAPAESPWDRLASQAPAKHADATPTEGPGPRERNAAISPAHLSVRRPLAARAFLDHVVLEPSQRGGFVVGAVLPGSLYERAGLQAGDTIRSLDLPDQPAVDEGNMVALTAVHEMAFEVVRQGSPVRLSVRLNEIDDHESR